MRSASADDCCLSLKPGARIIRDWNGETHEVLVVEDARLVFLPPYSPDLNLIEQVFAKLKAMLRKAQERTVDSVVERIGIVLKSFPPNECANYFRNAGYTSI